MKSELRVKHTVQMGHRLWSVPGKCERMHGHTWTCVLHLKGERNGPLLLDFHDIKAEWNEYLDEEWDHHFVMHDQDPLIKEESHWFANQLYPGVVVVEFLPTVENLSECWKERATQMYGWVGDVEIELWEGEVNCAVTTSE